MLAVCCRSVSPPVEWRRRYRDGGCRLLSWLAVGVYGWVVEVVAMVMMIRTFLFVPLFTRFTRGAASLTPTIVAYDSCVCVLVCSCVFVRSLPTYLPTCLGWVRTHLRVCVMVKRSLWTLTTTTTTTFGGFDGLYACVVDLVSGLGGGGRV